MSTAVAPEPVVDTLLTDAQAAVDAAEAARLAADPVVVPPVDAPASEPVVPAEVKYEFKVPDGTDPAIVERTTAIARELGLSNEAGQKLFDKEVAAEKANVESRTAAIDAWRPGGTEWTKRNDAWTAQVKADPVIGGANWDATKLAAEQAMTKFFPPEFADLLKETGFGSHPMAIRGLAAIGKAMAEGTLVHGSPTTVEKPKTAAELMYPGDGKGPKKDAA